MMNGQVGSYYLHISFKLYKILWNYIVSIIQASEIESAPNIG